MKVLIVLNIFEYQSAVAGFEVSGKGQQRE
jgi:hypothetical protein